MPDDNWDAACHVCGSMQCGCTPEDKAQMADEFVKCGTCGRQRSKSAGCPGTCVKDRSKDSMRGPVEISRLVHGAPDCEHCGDPVDAKTQTHWYDGTDQTGYGHKGLCCDCMDLSCGMALNGKYSINTERATKGKAPIMKCWPGLDEHGNKLAK
jgi:hypothetical protein